MIGCHGPKFGRKRGFFRLLGPVATLKLLHACGHQFIRSSLAFIDDENLAKSVAKSVLPGPTFVQFQDLCLAWRQPRRRHCVYDYVTP